jgi:hypothetical protein
MSDRRTPDTSAPRPVLSTSPSYSDERGTLVTTEFSDVPFPVSRAFTVRGPEGGAVRGNHFVSGAQLLVLLGGSVSVLNGPDAEHLGDEILLTELGSRILLDDGTYIRYTLPDADASVLVFCERPFVARN